MNLSRGERSIGELAAQFDMTLPGVTKHLRVLERAGLTDIRRDGRVRPPKEPSKRGRTRPR